MYPETRRGSNRSRTSEKCSIKGYDKKARNIVDPKTGEKMTIPSREDSYERLQEMAVQFPEENRSVEIRFSEKNRVNSYINSFRTLEKNGGWFPDSGAGNETPEQVASLLGLSRRR